MDIFVYSDESGVFDKIHNDIFVFGGIIFLNKNEKDIYSRKYISAEKIVRDKLKMNSNDEVKATTVSNECKSKLYRSLNNVIKFGVVINQPSVYDSIFTNKKDKQRYLDYAYKIAVKRCFEKLIKDKVINPNEIDTIHFYTDEHTTATNGRYELREGLEQELKLGTYNYNYSSHYLPLFPEMKSVELKFCNSSSVTLVRAADIVANRIYYMAMNKIDFTDSHDNLSVIFLP